MKSLLVLLLSLYSVGLIQAQTWTWSSEMPKAGEAVNVDLTFFDLEPNMHIVSFSFNGKDLVTTDITSVADLDGIHIKLPVPSETNWIRVVVKDEYGQALVGDHKPVVKVGAPAKSSLIEQSLAYSAYSRPMGMKQEATITTSQYWEAIGAYPAWLDNPDVLKGYNAMAKASNSQEDVKKIKSHLNTLDPKKHSEELFVNGYRIAKDMGDTVLYTSIRKKLDKMNPNSLVTQEEHSTSFTKAQLLEEKVNIRNDFKTKYVINDQNRFYLDRMTASLAEQYSTKEDWKQVETYVYEILDPIYKARECNSYAWDLAGGGIDVEAPHLDVAARMSLLSLTILTPDVKKPAYVSKSEWATSLESTKAQYGDTYALILYKQGKYNEALEHQAFAVKISKNEDLEMNERYAIYLEKAGQKEEALTYMDEMIENGKASDKMMEMHKRIWITEKTNDQLYTQYVTKLEAIAKQNRLEEIEAMWMDAPAASFTLKNLKGEEVSLADYKGKTVILDFWATWCGPCKASFPGMKNAVEHYAQDPNVVFLFIDTWEKGENIPDRVNTFIKDNNYPFHVLLDGKDQVVGNYKVDGIPTKFIIDKDQKIRFKSVGYGGDNEVLVEELITMIEMAQNGGKLQKS